MKQLGLSLVGAIKNFEQARRTKQQADAENPRTPCQTGRDDSPGRRAFGDEPRAAAQARNGAVYHAAACTEVPTYTNSVCVGVSPAYSRGHNKALPCPVPSQLVRGACRPLQSPESRQGGCKTFLPLPWEGDVSQVLPPSISVRSGPAASLAALRASGPAMCVATLGFIA